MTDPDTTELWVRNPHNYIRELMEVPDVRNIAWDRGMLVSRGIDPHKFSLVHFGNQPGWKSMAIGEQGAALVDFEHNMTNPLAVYPVWDYDQDDLDLLEELMRQPVGHNQALCSSPTMAADERPVYGQKHMIVLINLPDMGRNTSKALLRNIKELKEDNADTGVTLHVHGLYSFPGMFGHRMGSADYEPRSLAQKGRIILPPGKMIKFERAREVNHWIELLGMTPAELKVPRNRCIYNIKAAKWASENFVKDVKFKTTGKVSLNMETREVETPDVSRTKVLVGKIDKQEGDMITCNSCSLNLNCKYYREDAVCSMPDSESSALVAAFKSRDAGQIIDALGTVVGAQAQRLERGVELEEDFGEVDPHVTKMMNDLFKNGMALAKLIDPSLTKPQVVINNGVPAGPPKTQQQVMGEVFRRIEASGVARGDITRDMVEAELTRMRDAGELPAELTQ